MNGSLDYDDARRRSTLTVKSSGGGGRLSLGGGPWSGREVDGYDATLRSDGIEASARVYSYGTDGLPAFFDSLAANWRGWPGVETWGSLEGQLRIDAEHDGLGTVRLRVVLTPTAALERWSGMAVIDVDAGGLDYLSKLVHRFFEQ